MWANQASQMMGNGGTVGALTDLGTMLTVTTVANSYSRNHEDQADRVGLRYAYEGGYDVTKAMEIWKKFAEKYGDSPKAVNFFFGAHSRSAKRAELLDEQIEWNYGDPNSEE
jgi:Zn-dependent protease with chaperone function